MYSGHNKSSKININKLLKRLIADKSKLTFNWGREATEQETSTPI